MGCLLIAAGLNEIHIVRAETTPILRSYQGFAYHHATSGYDGAIDSAMHIGRDFDFWNEQWRGFTEFDISAIPDTANITQIRIRLQVLGKPEVCDHQRIQLQLFPVELQPSQHSHDYESLFNDFAEGTPYNNESFYLLSTDGLYPGESTWITFHGNMTTDFQEHLLFNWFALSFIDYYTADLGHDTDQDEGIICTVHDFEVDYQIAGEVFTAVFSQSDGIEDNSNQSGDNWGIFAILLILVILIGIILFVGFKNVRARSIKEGVPHHAKRLKKKGTPFQHPQKQQKEKLMLQKFKEILQISHRVKIADVARNLGLTYDELFSNLLRWQQDIPFKIDGEMIVVEDISTFIGALDTEFQTWDQSSEDSDSKIV